MTISKQVDDALFLHSNGRHMAALTLLLVAIGASSKKVFPLGTKSLEDPKKQKLMSDRESYTLFLGERIRSILFNAVEWPSNVGSGINVQFRKSHLDVAYILYKYVRNDLVHDGELPDDIEFSENGKSVSAHLTFIGGRHRVSVGIGSDKLVLDHGWIPLLVEAITNAPCNGTEFNKQHFTTNILPGIDEEKFLKDVGLEYNTSEGRVALFKDAVRKFKYIPIAESTDEVVVDTFLSLVRSGEVTAGTITGFYFHGFADSDGKLTDRGVSILRKIAGAYTVSET